MKLGLKIEITSQGASSAKTYNSTSALEKYASESRSFIKNAFPARADVRQKDSDANCSLDGSGRSVIFLRFLGPQGYLICIFQARPENSGRPYDGAAAWIHVPKSVFLTGQETQNLIDEVEKALFNERGIDYSRLENVFSHEYQEKQCMPAIATIRSNGDSSAVRYYGTNTTYQLYEFLGNNNIAQSEYSKYKAVFFLDTSDNLAFEGTKITSPLVSTRVIESPKSKDGFVPYLENGASFSMPIEIAVGTTINILWKKSGYKDIKKAITVTDKTSEPEFNFSNSDIMFEVRKNQFKVFSSDDSPLTNYTIKIGNKTLSSENDVIYWPKTKFDTPTCVSVHADGFETQNKDITLSPDTIPIRISMKKKMYSYKFTLPMFKDEGGEIKERGHLTLETSEKIHECPVKGYVLEDDYITEGKEIKLQPDKQDGKDGPLNVIKHFAYGFVSGLISCLIILCVWMGCHQNNKYEVKWVFLTPIEKTDEAKDLAKAIEYLKSTTKWDSKKMEQYKCLDGLFEDLNDYKLDSIINKWSPVLKDVSEFDKVVEAAKTAKKEKWNVRQGEHKPFYNNKDSLINISEYAEWLSKDQTPPSEAISYLNSTKTWDSKKMEQYKYLDGLFEDLNDYKLDSIINKWSRVLKDVPEFKNVVKNAENTKSKGWEPRHGEHAPVYDKGKTYRINISEYAEWLSKDQTPSKKKETTTQKATTNNIRGGLNNENNN